jgi:hypothetical protein
VGVLVEGTGIAVSLGRLVIVGSGGFGDGVRLGVGEAVKVNVGEEVNVEVAVDVNV